MRLSRSFVPTLEGNPGRGADRLAPADAARRPGAADLGRHLCLAAARAAACCSNIEQIVREEQDAAGAQELLMPTIQPAELWRESGRYDDYGQEMLRIRDRARPRDAVRPDQRGDDHRPDAPVGARATATCRRSSTTSSGSSATRCGRASASCAAASS